MIAALLSPIGRWAVAALIVLGLLGGTYAIGRRHGAAAASAKWQVAMAAEQTRQAAVRAKALDAAVSRELARAAEAKSLQSQVESYETQLASRPADSRCTLSSADAASLRKLQGDAAR